jgi:ribosomal protein L16/L10AE
MDIQAAKIELVKLILSINNHRLIENMINVLKSGDEDFWAKLSIQEQEEIRLGIKQLEAGERVLLSDFLKKVS